MRKYYKYITCKSILLHFQVLSTLIAMMAIGGSLSASACGDGNSVEGRRLRSLALADIGVFRVAQERIHVTEMCVVRI